MNQKVILHGQILQDLVMETDGGSDQARMAKDKQQVTLPTRQSRLRMKWILQELEMEDLTAPLTSL